MECVFETAVNPPHLVNSIKRDHMEFRRLWLEYQKSSEREFKNRVMNEMVKGISIHNVIEERFLYPTLATAPIDRAQHHSEHGLKEHQLADDQFYELQGLEPGSEKYEELLKVAMKKFMHHIEEEEVKWLNDLPAALGEEAMAKIGKEMDEARPNAPTRPHPMMPNYPPFETIAAAVQAPIDRLKDKIEGKEFLSGEQKNTSEIASKTAK